MTRHPIALAIVLAFVTSAALSGCDRITGLTEQQHIQRAKDFEDKGNLKGSIVELKNAIQKNPDSPQARLLLGQIYLKAGMGAEAEKELTQAEKLGVSRESIKVHLGDALLNMGEYKRVLDEIQPSDQTSNVNLARIFQIRAEALLRQGQLKDACDLFQRSLDADKSNPATYWGLAQCAVAENNLPKAQGWLDTALKIKDKQAKTWVFVGDLKQINNDIESSLAAYSNALKIEPENLVALQSRATVNTRLGRIELARVDIETIRKLAPKSLSANYLHALLSFKERKYPEARGSLQEALKIAPDYLPALLLGGSIEYALGNLQTAELHLNKVVRAAPGNGTARRMLAATQLRLGRPDDASKTIAPIDFEKTEDASIHMVAGEIALAKKDFAKAAVHFERATQIKPDNSAIRLELGVIRLAQGDQRAMDDLQASADMEAGGSRADTVIILSQLKQKKFDAALVSIAALEKKQGASPLTWQYRGAAQLGKNDLVKARESFTQALKLDTKFFPAAVNLARLDMWEKKPAAARKRFESIIEQDKNNISAMMALADLAAVEKNDKDYVNWLEKAVKADPKALQPHIRLTNFYLTKKEFTKALAQAQEAASANPESLGALNLLGTTQMAAGDKAASIATFSHMTQKAPQSPGVLVQLALAQISDKQFDAARSNLKKTLQINPDFPKAQEALIQLELADNKPEAARSVARQIQSQQPKSPLGFDHEGDILLSRNNYPQAIKAYEQALGNGGGSASLIKLHRALTLSGDTKSAEQRLTSWLTQYPEDVTVRSYAAEYYLSTNRNRDAITQYEILLKREPQNALVLNNLANMYLREKDARALPTAEQALKLAPDHPGILDTLGWILVEQGQFKRGLDLLGKAKTKAPQAGSIHYHYAVAQARSGNKTEARKQLKQLLSSGLKFPEHEEAKKMLKELGET